MNVYAPSLALMADLFGVQGNTAFQLSKQRKVASMYSGKVWARRLNLGTVRLQVLTYMRKRSTDTKYSEDRRV